MSRAAPEGQGNCFRVWYQSWIRLISAVQFDIKYPAKHNIVFFTTKLAKKVSAVISGPPLMKKLLAPLKLPKVVNLPSFQALA